MKFKIGDRVKVVNIINDEYITLPHNQIINQIGIVINILFNNNFEYPYYIEFNNKKINEYNNNLWAEEELELVDCNNVSNNATNNPACFGEYCEHLENIDEHRKCLECNYLMQCSYKM